MTDIFLSRTVCRTLSDKIKFIGTTATTFLWSGGGRRDVQYWMYYGLIVLASGTRLQAYGEPS